MPQLNLSWKCIPSFFFYFFYITLEITEISIGGLFAPKYNLNSFLRLNVGFSIQNLKLRFFFFLWLFPVTRKNCHCLAVLLSLSDTQVWIFKKFGLNRWVHFYFDLKSHFFIFITTFSLSSWILWPFSTIFCPLICWHLIKTNFLPLNYLDIKFIWSTFVFIFFLFINYSFIYFIHWILFLFLTWKYFLEFFLNKKIIFLHLPL